MHGPLALFPFPFFLPLFVPQLFVVEMRQQLGYEPRAVRTAPARDVIDSLDQLVGKAPEFFETDGNEETPDWARAEFFAIDSTSACVMPDRSFAAA
jgi:hypothetical protein